MSTTATPWSLRRLDRRSVTPASDEVLACAIVRNEVHRVRPLIDHHRRLGVDRFLIVDNGSTDGTVEALLAEDDVHVWQTDADFRAAAFGSRIFQALLDEHGSGRWTVIVDADECFVYPDWEQRPITDLCAQLDGEGARAYGAVLLDLYSDRALADTVLSDDASPLDVACWFDRRWRHLEVVACGPYENQVGVFGGVRRRLFGGSAWDYCLSKVPLLRFDADAHLVGGQHWTNLDLARERGAVLHFKLTARLGDYAWDELARGQRPPDDEYHRYAEALALRPRLSAYAPDESVRYRGSAQLVDLGIMGPVEDPGRAAALAEGLTAHAATRIEAGETERAVALLERAAAMAPTGVNALVMLAQVRRRGGDAASADAALAEAAARRPDDLDVLGCAVGGPPVPPTVDRGAVPVPPGGIALVRSVDAAFGPWGGGVPTGPWVGFVHGVSAAPAHLPPYRDLSLAGLVARPGFGHATAECRALVTFTTAAATILCDALDAAGADVEVAVVPPPVEDLPIAFDTDRYLERPTVVQPGWWMTRFGSVCDLRTPPAVRKVRCVEVPFGRLATALARAQRLHDGWPVDPVPLRATRDLGPCPPVAMDGLLTDVVVLADLIDANADPVVLRCLERGLPVVVPALPGVVEILGRDYPLHFDDLDSVVGLVGDAARVRAAHEHVVERRKALTPARFVEAVAAVWEGLRGVR